MFPDSRINIYDFVRNMFYDVVTKNVYSMNPPQEMTESDAKDGFIVISVGDLYDESEFYGKAYGWARVFVEAYIPQKSRGRLNKNKYAAFENAINAVIKEWDAKVEPTDYSIDIESLISTDDYYIPNQGSVCQVLVKSFIVYKNDDVDVAYLGDLYIGLGDAELIDESSVENLVNVQHFNIDEPVGDYMIAFPNTYYLWLCTTNVISKVVSSEIDVPMEEPITIGNLKCYRSSNAILEGTMEFEITI